MSGLTLYAIMHMDPQLALLDLMNALFMRRDRLTCYITHTHTLVGKMCTCGCDGLDDSICFYSDANSQHQYACVLPSLMQGSEATAMCLSQGNVKVASCFGNMLLCQAEIDGGESMLRDLGFDTFRDIKCWWEEDHHMKHPEGRLCKPPVLCIREFTFVPTSVTGFGRDPHLFGHGILSLEWIERCHSSPKSTSIVIRSGAIKLMWNCGKHLKELMSIA